MTFKGVEPTEQELKNIIIRIRKIKGQISSLEKSVCNKPDLYRILQQIAAANGALRALTHEIMEIEIKNGIYQESTSDDTKQKATDTIMKMMRSYLK